MCVAEALGFGGAARRVVARVEIDHDGFAGEVCELDLAALRRFERERGGLLANGEHGRVDTTCYLDPNVAHAARGRTRRLRRSATRGPAWPKSSATEGDDGGESLAPRPSAHELSAPVENDEVAETPALVAPKAAAPEATPAVTPMVTPSIEEPTTTEEITIEIDDD